jgi:hypothetical protein
VAAVVGEPAPAQVEAVVEAAQAEERGQVDPAAEAEDLAVEAGEPAQGQAEAVVEAV